jgi:hypothetical protein
MHRSSLEMNQTRPYCSRRVNAGLATFAHVHRVRKHEWTMRKSIPLRAPFELMHSTVRVHPGLFQHLTKWRWGVQLLTLFPEYSSKILLTSGILCRNHPQRSSSNDIKATGDTACCLTIHATIVTKEEMLTNDILSLLVDGSVSRHSQFNSDTGTSASSCDLQSLASLAHRLPLDNDSFSSNSSSRSAKSDSNSQPVLCCYDSSVIRTTRAGPKGPDTPNARHEEHFALRPQKRDNRRYRTVASTPDDGSWQFRRW